MNVTGYLSLILAVIVRSATLSVLTDGNIQNSAIQDLAGMDVKNVDVFRQLLNQETIIRMTLVKNVHALMKDMLTLKENLSVAERKISTLQTSTNSQTGLISPFIHISSYWAHLFHELGQVR